MPPYNHLEIEKKWQKQWEEEKLFAARDFSEKEKFYGLIEFPYPSGEGLHVGHPRSYTAMDVICRKKRMQGKNVLFPIGFDAFGLPAENYAIKTGTHPAITTAKNIANFTRQLKSLGYSFDWDRRVNTTDPAYYKWTQWIFLKLFEKGLAYKKEMPTNWCTSCNVTLANEEVVNGRCERCNNEVVRKNKKQWMLKITAYADRLIDDLATVDYPREIKDQQIHWIGRSHGAEIGFPITGSATSLTVFTTRPETLFGATYLVLAPEHEMVETLVTPKQRKQVEAYQYQTQKKSDIDRAGADKTKTGVFTGAYALNPATGKDIPIWIADYVLLSYSTGAIMAVPAHDTRDSDFAKKFDLPIQEVISGGDPEHEAHTGEGMLINSDFLNGLDVQSAREKMNQWLESEHKGRATVGFKLRDWVFSRQRYWGEPIPIIICPQCEYVPLSEADLPLELPALPNYKPTASGESPLAYVDEWVNVLCPKCGGSAKRETDTMPQWAGSSWYFLRYIDPKNDSTLADAKKLQYWFPVDWYSGGFEHTTLHLLYSRFWNKFLFDIGVVQEGEPYKKRVSHGLILGDGGIKMSKSKGNVVNPDDIVEKFGADTFRTYMMFMGPFDQAIPWDDKGVVGVRRFLEKILQLQEKIVLAVSTADPSMERLMHKTIKKVSEDIDAMHFNTAISSLMIFVNALTKQDRVTQDWFLILLKLLFPFAPHLAQELWFQLGNSGFLDLQTWPMHDQQLAINEQFQLPIQINGKVREKLTVSADISESELKELVFSSEKVQKWLSGKQPKKFLYIQGRLVSIVV